jgi:hypothetical protein
MQLYAFQHQPFEYQKHQIIYLRYRCNKTPKEIEPFVDYAYSTIKNYIYKFQNLLAESIGMFYHERKISEWTGDIKNEPPGEKCYFMQFFDDKGKFLFVKIGKTKDAVSIRARHLYNQYSTPVGKINILAVFPSGGIHGEGMESYCRAMFMLKYSKYFIKNDRFSYNIPVEEYKKYCQEYLKKFEETP